MFGSIRLRSRDTSDGFNPENTGYTGGSAFSRSNRVDQRYAVPISAREYQAGINPFHLFRDVLEPAVAEDVLGNRLGPDLDRFERRLAPSSQERPEVVQHSSRKGLGIGLHKIRISSTADKCGKQNMAFGSAIGEQRR